MPIEKVFEGSINYVQVLDKDGNIDENLDPKLPKDMLLRMYVAMLLTRMFNDKCLKLQRQGRLVTYPPSLGQEAAQVGSIAPFNQEDWMIPSYREHAVYLWRGLSLKNLFTYWMGSEKGMKMEGSYKNNLMVSIQLLSSITWCWNCMGIKKF